MTISSGSRIGGFDAGVEAIQCEHPGCAATALHRAPKHRNRLDDYYWFCLDHVREYNRSWNFYSGMTDFQVESEIRNDTVWRRPSWPFGNSAGAGSFNANARFRDDLGVFDEAGYIDERARRDAARKRQRHDSRIERALLAMDYDGPVNLTALKSRYKELVKRLHPDANGGDRAAEEKLKEINQAYATLKKFLST